MICVVLLPKPKKYLHNIKKLMKLVLFHVTSAKRISQGCSHREHTSKVNSSNKFSCTLCDFMKDIKNLDKHIKNCKKYNLSNEKLKLTNVIKCAFCNIDFGDLDSLRKHGRLYLSILCNKCGKRFTSNRKLTEHKKISHREPKECEYCQKKLDHQ